MLFFWKTISAGVVVFRENDKYVYCCLSENDKEIDCCLEKTIKSVLSLGQEVLVIAVFS